MKSNKQRLQECIKLMEKITGKKVVLKESHSDDNMLKQILDQGDGPVDRYVVIVRAFKYAIGNHLDPSLAAETLEEALTTLEHNGGQLDSNERF